MAKRASDEARGSFFFCFLIAPAVHATTYYISAIGADTNNGTTKTTSWLHAPGMTNCSNTCASTTPQPGDSFIFRGGDTWHFGNSGASPYVGAKNGCELWGLVPVQRIANLHRRRSNLVHRRIVGKADHER